MSTVVIHRNLEDDNYVWDTNTLSWVKMTQPGATGSVAISSIPTGNGRTLLYGIISQGGAGTTSLVTADGTRHIKVVSYVVVISAIGNCKFIDGSGDLTGNLPLVANSGVSAISDAATPLFQTAINSALSIVTTGGAAFGHFTYFLE